MTPVNAAGKVLRAPRPGLSGDGSGREGRRARPSLAGSLNGTLKAHDEDLLDPEPILAGDEVLTLALSGDPRDPGVEAEYVTYPSAVPVKAPSLVAAPTALADLPRLDARWLAGLPTLPGRIKGDDRSIRGLIVADAGTERIIQRKAVMGSDLEEAARILFGVFDGENAVAVRGLPRQIVFSTRSLFNAAAPGLETLGVRCAFEPRMPVLEGIKERFEASLSGAAAGPEEDPDDEADRDVVPAADDLES